MTLGRPVMAPLAKPYDAVADEYYDSIRHPTCSNFREASLLYLDSINSRIKLGGKLLDVGAGKSVVAEILLKKSQTLNNTTILDHSLPMLRHSKVYLDQGANLIVAEATALPVRDRSQDFIIASLADPYNTSLFWREVNRCLAADGHCIFTTPSFLWASHFRLNTETEKESSALFELRNQTTIYVPSLIYNRSDQLSLIDSEGLVAEDTTDVFVDALKTPLSGKLLIARGPSRMPAVTGYVIRKKQQNLSRPPTTRSLT